MQAFAQAYQQTARTGLTTRQLEAEVLLRAARELDAARGDPGEDRGTRLLAALERQRQTWSLLSLHLRREDSDLPEPLRTSMLQIAASVFATIADIADQLGRQEPTDDLRLERMAEINRILAAGLSATPANPSLSPLPAATGADHAPQGRSATA